MARYSTNGTCRKLKLVPPKSIKRLIDKALDSFLSVYIQNAARVSATCLSAATTCLLLPVCLQLPPVGLPPACLHLPPVCGYLSVCSYHLSAAT